MTAVLVDAGGFDQVRALHDQHAHALWSYVVGLTGGDRGKAQDVVQETLLRALRNLAGLEQSGGSARGWLFTVAKRIVIDDWRAAARRPEVSTDRVPSRRWKTRCSRPWTGS
jgi:RNA polymerase sigma-70 factor, ECF subfamily